VKYFDLTGKVKTKGELEKLFGEISLPPPPKPTTKKKGEVEISVAVNTYIRSLLLALFI
jgi:hypothetical protein